MTTTICKCGSQTPGTSPTPSPGATVLHAGGGFSESCCYVLFRHDDPKHEQAEMFTE